MSVCCICNCAFGCRVSSLIINNRIVLSWRGFYLINVHLLNITQISASYPYLLQLTYKQHSLVHNLQPCLWCFFFFFSSFPFSSFLLFLLLFLLFFFLFFFSCSCSSSSSMTLQLWYSLGRPNNILPCTTILRLFYPFWEFHLFQIILDIIFPSWLGSSYWSSCLWFPFVYFLYNNRIRHSIYMSKPTQYLRFIIIYHVPLLY